MRRQRDSIEPRLWALVSVDLPLGECVSQPRPETMSLSRTPHLIIVPSTRDPPVIQPNDLAGRLLLLI